MEQVVQSQAESTNCPVCGVKVLQSRLPKHLQKVHSPAAELQRITREQREAAEREAGNELVPCYVCNQTMRRRKLTAHLKKAHRIGLAPTLKMGNGPSFGEVLKALEAKPSKAKKELRSTDPFDLGLTISGGAFGNGKRR
ncbi:MAG TPA: hypothetical protein DCS87_08730 [Rheinheimera sp.]|nr:hypothetical protein [Rheinheimera sp.]